MSTQFSTARPVPPYSNKYFYSQENATTISRFYSNRPRLGGMTTSIRAPERENLQEIASLAKLVSLPLISDALEGRLKPMIARIWHGYTTPAQADEYEATLRAEILPGISEVRGYMGSYLLR